MPKKPETLFKERLQPLLNAIPKSWWFKTQQLSTLGIPDIVGCVDGTFVALELKRDLKESLKKHSLQRHVLGLISKAGGFSAIVYPENSADIIAKIRSL